MDPTNSSRFQYPNPERTKAGSPADDDTIMPSSHSSRSQIDSDIPPEPPKHFSHTRGSSKYSENSDESGESRHSVSSKASGTSDFKGFSPPKPPKSREVANRESYVSSFSDYSGRIDNVDDMGAQPTMVKLVEGKDKPQQDFSDLTSEASSVHIGKLPTIKTMSQQNPNTEYVSPVKVKPDSSFETSIESAVPRRSPRRPKSDIWSDAATKEKKKRNRKTMSLTLSDDLDNLMESASSYKEETEKTEKTEAEEGRPEKHRGSFKDPKRYEFERSDTEESSLGEKKTPLAATSTQSDESDIPSPSLETEPVFDSHALPVKSNAAATPRSGASLPPRPAPEHVRRAREVSSVIQEREEQEKERIMTGGSEEKDVPEVPVDLNADQVDNESEELYHSPDKNSQQLKEAELVDSDASPKTKATSFQFNSPELAHERQNSGSSFYPDSRKHSVPESYKNTQPLQINREFNSDDDYYDIGDPVLVHKPSRAKSVKDATKVPGHKRVKSKTKKIRHSTGSKRASTDLKPFSYNTLISLLESMNGTIIGEEFSQLNLPVKEKQLIEKIVDSLSRLTSDMVIDESRYEVGIQRLEKALRVLEGFM